MSNPGGRQDPLTAFCFSLQIAGIVESGEAFFKSVGGLKSESEVVPYREGGLNSHTHQLVGAIKWPNLVLKRGFVARTGYKLLEWRQSWVADDPRVQLIRRSGKIIQLDSQMQEVCSWVFYDGWPCKWEGPDYDASKTELAIETVEIAHSGLFFQPGPSRSVPSQPRAAGQPAGAGGQQPGVGKPPKMTDAERQEMLDNLDGGPPPPQPGVGKPPKMTDAERQEMLDNLDGGPPAQQPGVGQPPKLTDAERKQLNDDLEDSPRPPGVGRPPKQTDAERQELLDSLDGGPPAQQPGVGKPPKQTDAERQELLDSLDGGPPAQQPGVGKPPDLSDAERKQLNDDLEDSPRPPGVGEPPKMTDEERQKLLDDLE
jgi:phage tail-like protein